LGSNAALSTPDLLRRYRISCVLTTASELNPKLGPSIAHKKIPVDDQPLESIREYL
jgi:hypothetical protein